MNAPAHDGMTPTSHAAKRVSDLLMRYPDVSPDEIEILIQEFPKLTTLDFVLMSSNLHLAPKIESFRKDQRHRLKNHHGRVLAIILVVPVALLAIIGWAASW